MKKLLFAAALVACGGGKSPTTISTAPEPIPAPAPSPDTTTATPDIAGVPPASKKPELGTWGFDSKGMDTTVAPGKSFYQYANGSWVKNTPIPADKSNYGMFTALADRSDDRTKQIILTAKGAPGTEAGKIGDYYKSFMDEAAIEAAGLKPIQASLDKIAAIKDVKGLTAAFATSARHFQKGPFATVVTQDDREPEIHIANIGQSGLGLPDRDMYDVKAKQFEPVREGYKKYIVAMLELAGTPDAAKRGAAIYALEEKIAAVHWTRVQNRDPQKTYNKWTVAQLSQKAPGVDWKLWLQDTGLGGEKFVNVNQPGPVAAIAKLATSQPLAVWKDYLTLRLLADTSDYLPKKFVDTSFEMYGKTLSGTPQIKDRWKRGVDEVTGALGEAVGKLYVDKYFNAATKAQADKLVGNLLTAMGQRLDALTWMTDATKAKAKAKLATYNPKIGFPKKWRDYSTLEVKAGDPVGNAMRAAAFEYDRRLAKLGKPVDRDEWGMTPMTVNAYYNPSLNEIVFPAAILQPPFFDPNADDAVNYGGIGAVIGHEISHGFDDQGSQYDATGALKNWWGKDDTTKFKAATKRLVAQYDGYCPVQKPTKLCVKGALTLGENIADLAGLTVAYSAYKLSLGGKEAPVIEGVTGDQRFFLGWAQVWRRSYRDQEFANRLSTDVHSPSEFRTSVVRNLDAWYNAFKPAATDDLFLADDKRIKIW
ncbi:MAG: M13 family metallopeptidase [Kofleriaceae bacterium]